ncbi:hypothetical protein [Roseomonas indoligenes]|uniref:Uncharacterized protein n=1 Tax=Roseomonas indoligenes TaxID=2820811 RepID=A0A940MZC0_9PROT|nr:hypothetical protein [Pararoseomonas indoligenes]MBP0493231.1 hypothetical protein [Pararoseomonas indoligenes]
MQRWAKWILVAALAAPLAAADAQQPQGGVPAQAAPHAWLFGTWTGGIFPATETEGAACAAQPTVVFTRDVIMRVSLLDVPYRQRLIETVSGGPDAVEFRLAPAGAAIPPLGGRLPPDSAFGCANPNALRVERRGPNEIVFPNCAEFPSPLKRCTTGN